MTTSHDAGIQLRWRYVAAGRTANGLFKATNAGALWSPLGTGFPANPGVNARRRSVPTWGTRATPA
jgi:hypothetical protein